MLLDYGRLKDYKLALRSGPEKVSSYKTSVFAEIRLEMSGQNSNKSMRDATREGDFLIFRGPTSWRDFGKLCGGGGPVFLLKLFTNRALIFGSLNF